MKAETKAIPISLPLYAGENLVGHVELLTKFKIYISKSAENLKHSVTEKHE